MRGPIYKMPPSKPLLKIEDLDKKVEDIIDLKLKDIFSRLDKIEKKVNFDEKPITDYVSDITPLKSRIERIEKTVDIHDHLWDITANAFTKVPMSKDDEKQQQQDKEN